MVAAAARHGHGPECCGFKLWPDELAVAGLEQTALGIGQGFGMMSADAEYRHTIAFSAQLCGGPAGLVAGYAISN